MPARFTSLMCGHYPPRHARPPAQHERLDALAAAALDELADAVGAEVGALWGAREEGGRAGAPRGPRAGARRGAADRDGRVRDSAGRAVAEARVVTATHPDGGLEVAGLTGPARVALEIHVPLRLGHGGARRRRARLPRAEPGCGRRARCRRWPTRRASRSPICRSARRRRREARLGRAVLDATPDAIALVGPAGRGARAERADARAAGGSASDALDVPPDDAGGGAPRRADARRAAGGCSRAGARRWRTAATATVGGSSCCATSRAERDSERLKDEVLALVSHELRTPLTSVVGYVDLVLDGSDELSPDVRRFLEVVERNARRLLRLVGDLLFVAQVEAGAGARARARSTSARSRPTRSRPRGPRPSGQGATLVLDAEPVRTFTRRPRPLRAGARQPHRQRREVHGRRRPHPGHGRPSAASSRSSRSPTTGPGIPLEEQARVFERFARASNAAERAVAGRGAGPDGREGDRRGPRRRGRRAQRAGCGDDDARGAAVGLAAECLADLLRDRAWPVGQVVLGEAQDGVAGELQGVGGGAVALEGVACAVASQPSTSTTSRWSCQMKSTRGLVPCWVCGRLMRWRSQIRSSRSSSPDWVPAWSLR